MGACYTLQNGGNVVWRGPVPGRVSLELWVWMWIHPGTDEVLSGDDVDCSHELKPNFAEDGKV
jgi:hypothetical protein